MSKLWILGDSYGAHVYTDEKFKTPWFWAQQICEKLGCDHYYNFCQPGIANEFTQQVLNNSIEKISSDDYVILISTQPQRQWFFDKYPHMANYYNLNFLETVGREKANAVRQYAMYLESDRRIINSFNQFLGWVHYFTDKHNLNLIVVPGFESSEGGFPISHLYNVKGSLLDVSNNEFSSHDDDNWFRNQFCGDGFDWRAGHLLKDNHYILADKIYNTFINKEELNLNDGFKKKVVNKNIDKNYLLSQLSECRVTLSNANKYKSVSF